MDVQNLSFHEREQLLRCPNCGQVDWRFYVSHRGKLVSPMGIELSNFGEYDDAHGVICDGCEADAPQAVLELVQEGLSTET